MITVRSSARAGIRATSRALVNIRRGFIDRSPIDSPQRTRRRRLVTHPNIARSVILALALIVPVQAYAQPIDHTTKIECSRTNQVLTTTILYLQARTSNNGTKYVVDMMEMYQ